MPPMYPDCLSNQDRIGSDFHERDRSWTSSGIAEGSG
jgi:hypothetical protein